MTRTLGIIVAALVVAAASQAAAQQARSHRIGFLSASGPGALQTRMEAMLAELGYVEGRNAVFERRFAEGRFERMAALAEDLVGREVDIIVAISTPAALAAKRATTTIPIVVTNSGDAVGSGLVASLARPGGNVTGNSFLGTEIAAKQVQIIKELVPSAARVAFLANRAMSPELLFFEQMQGAAHSLGVAIDFVDARSPDDFEHAMAEIGRLGAEAIIVAPGGNYFDQRPRLLNLIERRSIPALYFQREYVEEGGLVSHGPSHSELYRRAAIYVDRILKGAKPADLPVQQPTTFELIVNLKTAKALGLKIPESILVRAGEVIE